MQRKQTSEDGVDGLAVCDCIFDEADVSCRRCTVEIVVKNYGTGSVNNKMGSIARFCPRGGGGALLA